MSGPNFKKIIEQLSNKLDAISSEEYAKKLDERPLGDVGSFLLETGFFSQQPLPKFGVHLRFLTLKQQTAEHGYYLNVDELKAEYDRELDAILGEK